MTMTRTKFKRRIPILLTLSLIILITLSDCRRGEVERGSTLPTKNFLTESQRTDLQNYCDHLADSADAGIALTDLRTRKLLILSNRTYIVESIHQPASTFKLITAVAALLRNESRLHDFRCDGKIILQGDTIHCWDKNGHGPLTLESAIEKSCNCYFAELGMRIPSEEILSVAQQLGYGKKTLFHSAGEPDGILARTIPPKEKILLALGHSAGCEVSGLQLLQLMSTLATGGKFISRENLFPWKKLEVITRGMEKAVLQGTAQPALVSSYPAAGKTGTLRGNTQWETRAWFVGYAPYDDPQCAIVVYCQNGTGKNNAAPLAGLVFQKISSMIQP